MFGEKIVAVPGFLAETTFQRLLDAFQRQRQSQRVHIPVHKRGAALSYHDLQHSAPEIILETTLVPNVVAGFSPRSILWLDRHRAAGPLLESSFDGIHSLVGELHGVSYACGIGRNTGQSTAHAEMHSPVWLVRGIPNHHVAEFSDLRAKVASLGEGQYHEFVAAEAADQLGMIEGCAKVRSNADESRITGFVPVVVVYSLERVDVNEDYREIQAGERFAGGLESAAVCKASELVHCGITYR